MTGTVQPSTINGRTLTSSPGDRWMVLLRKQGVHLRRGCWIVGNDEDRYPLVYSRGEQVRAHRLVYAELRPDEDITDMHVHHMCETPACINPEHLVAMTPSDHSTWHARHRR